LRRGWKTAAGSTFEKATRATNGLATRLDAKKRLIPTSGPVPARLFRKMNGTVEPAEVFFDGNGKKLKPARMQVKPGEIKRVETPQTGKEYSE
jgi:hypothetical protein